MQANLIRAFTPLLLATLGGAIGVAVLFLPQNADSVKWSAGMGLAGTAIAAAAGLAQPSNNKYPETVEEATKMEYNRQY
jgi:hypothetical protein